MLRTWPTEYSLGVLARFHPSGTQKVILVLAALALVLGLDYITGTSIDAGFFYFLPVILACVFWGAYGWFMVPVAVLLYYVSYYPFFSLAQPAVIGNTLVKIGSLTSIALLTTMTTELFKREQRLKREILLRYREIEWMMKTLHEGLVVIDAQGRVTQMNPRAEEFLGVKEPDALGKTLASLPLAPELTEALGKLDLVYAEDGLEISLLGPFPRNYRLFRFPVRDEEGVHLGTVLAIHDISKEKVMERMKEEFLATVTHDLKSPLASIMGYAELMADPRLGEISETKLKYVHTLHHLGGILLGLLNNIMIIPRIEAGQMNYAFENFDLGELLKEVSDTFKPQADLAKVELGFECPPEVWVHADLGRIRQVFYNLVSNALRYTPQGGSVTVKAFTEDKRVFMEVADTGRGISPEDLPHIFQKFYQGRGERRGTGLGLYIIKSILQGHGTDVQIESKIGAGTRVFFTLDQGQAVSQGLTGHHRLLFLGDDANIPLAMEILGNEGHAVEHCREGSQAIECVLTFKPDLILVYHPLPDVLVANLKRILRGNLSTRNIPLVLVSSVMVPEWQGEFSAIVTMPSGMGVLRDTVRSLLEEGVVHTSPGI